MANSRRPASTPSQDDDGPLLLPTLQVHLGVVLCSGKPKQRSHITLGSHAALVKNRAACHDHTVSKDELIRYLCADKRLDNEQAAAMALSYVNNVYGNLPELMHSVEHMLTTTHMWRTPEDSWMHGDSNIIATVKKQNMAWQNAKGDRDRWGFDGSFETPSVDELLALLKRVRRIRPGVAVSQRLRFSAPLLKRLHYEERRSWAQRLSEQDDVLEDDPIMLSKINFRRIQRLVMSMYGNGGDFIRSVRDLSRDLTLGNISVLESSSDPFAISYSFIAFQRKKQLKVVTNISGSVFLSKGSVQLIQQNVPYNPSSFETILIRRATDRKALSSIVPPPSFPSIDKRKLLGQVRAVCELMEKYVQIYGKGDIRRLQFSRDVEGGSGRGPVDAYNRLVDLLAMLRRRCEVAGIPLKMGPCHKFLAKDIMNFHESWKDDAFADKKIPGWMGYLYGLRL
ncbi:hypothetical protein DFJ77DRAFT_258361 [Powellomyces hirtus]|nr:hypothetical protein DFJ77DRAFT_258361 [Powellomyces hirtus]